MFTNEKKETVYKYEFENMIIAKVWRNKCKRCSQTKFELTIADINGLAVTNFWRRNTNNKIKDAQLSTH